MNYSFFSIVRALPGVALLFSFTTASAQIAFTDNTDAAIGSFRSETWGASIGDFNGDRWPDIWVSNHRERPILYRNSGDGTFTNSILTVAGDEFFVTNRYLDQHSAAWADIDNDGDDDLMMQGNGNGLVTPSGLLISNGVDAIDDLASDWGLPPFGGQGIGWVDFDLDGDLDLFRSNQGSSSVPLMYRRFGATQFLGGFTVPGCGGSNSILVSDVDEDGNPDFVCVSQGLFPREVFALGSDSLNSIVDDLAIPAIFNVIDIASADFDNDLDPDLMFARGTTQKNQALASDSRTIEAMLDGSPIQGEAGFSFTGGGVLTVTVYAGQPFYFERRGTAATERTRSRRVPVTLDPADQTLHGLAQSRTDRALYFGYDPLSDQWDIVLAATTGYQAYYVTIESTDPMSDVVTYGLQNVDGPMRPEYLRNDGAGTYSREVQSTNLPLLECAGMAAGDFDNDMDVDLYFVCQRGAENISNRLFANDGSGEFSEVSGAGGAMGAIGPSLFGNNGWGDNVAVADFDNDGFLDLFVTNGVNNYPTRNRAGRHQVFMNDGASANWIRFHLKGTTSDPTALGARVFVDAGGVEQMRDQNGGYHHWTQNHQLVHFGLASNTSADVSVRWPDGLIENFGTLDANADYELVQGGSATVVTPGAVTPFPALSAGDECDEPDITRDLDRAVFIYKDCTSGLWRVRVSGGGDLEGTTFSGGIQSDAPLTDIVPRDLESIDSVSGDQNLSFNLNTSNSDLDEFEFEIPTTVTSACFRVNSPTNVPIMFGADYRRAEAAIDLVTMQPCAIVSTPTLSISDFTVDESVGVAQVPLTLTSPTATDVTATVFTRNTGTAITGQDFYGVTRQVTIPAGSISTAFAFTVIDDAANEGDENLTVRVVNVSGANSGQTESVVTIADNDVAGAPELTISDTTVNESVGAATLTVTLSLPVDASVRVFTKVGTAGGGTDFYGFTSTINFSAGSQSEDVTVTILNDSVSEATEQLSLRLFDASGATIVKRDGVIEIVDDD